MIVLRALLDNVSLWGEGDMQDRVQEVLKSLENEWCLGERLSLRDGLEAMMRRKNQDTREIRETGRYGDVEEYLRQERGSWVSPTYEEVMEQIRLFSDEDQARFLRELNEGISEARACFLG